MDKLYIKISEPEKRKAHIEIDGFIGGYDDDWNPKNRGCDIRKELEQIDALDVDEIEVVISSLGGSVDHAFQIHDALKRHKCRIVTTVTGLCASGGTIIACAGDVRRISPNSLYLIHKCWGCSCGNENQLEADADMCRKVDRSQRKIYMSVSTKSEEEIAALMNENNGDGKWLTAEETVEYGFATEIYDGGEEDTQAKAAMRGGLMASFLNRAREIYRPRTVIMTVREDGGTGNNPNQTNTNSNQSQKEMKKILTTFALLAAALAYGAEKEFDEKEGLTLNAEELNKLEEALKAGKQAATDLESVKAQLQTKTEELTAAQAKAEQDKTAIETLTAERDTYKAKYEKQPAQVQTPAANDPKEEGESEDLKAMYAELEKMY